MIVDEIIYFDSDQLRHASTIEDKLILTRKFFSSFPAISNVKLKFMIELLKERENDERPYTYLSTYFLLCICLTIALIAAAMSFARTTLLNHLKMEIATIALILFVVLLALHKYISFAKKKQKYGRIIQILELYYIERTEFPSG